MLESLLGKGLDLEQLSQAINAINQLDAKITAIQKGIDRLEAGQQKLRESMDRVLFLAEMLNKQSKNPASDAFRYTNEGLPPHGEQPH